ncbi:MAG: type II secretion system F family protein [Gammaproteobacteria bacterium]|nr:type II secretion system F family protein [Gammaproteobacteria bacterium]
MLFAFKAVRPNGENLEGERDAPDEQTLVRELQAEGAIPIEIRPAGGLRILLRAGRTPRGTRFRAQQVAVLTRELSTLLGAGLTLDRSLQVLHDLTRDAATRRLLAALRDRIQSGSTFAAALEAEHQVFSKLYINMVRAGESGGVLEAVLERLADYLERSAQLRERVRSALTYPMILVVVAGLSIVLLLAFVVPQFSQMFADMGETLPLPTRIVVTVGDLFRDYWWAALAALALAAAAVQAALQRPRVREWWDQRVIRLPLFGDLIVKVEAARFARTLSTLLENGLPLLGALNLVREVVENRRVAETIDVAAQHLKRGKGFAEPLIQDGILPDLALQMIKVGEESGQLDSMLAKVADVFDREVGTTVQRMLTLLEPALIVGLGVIVAGIIISILVAIMQANQLAF